MKLYLSPKAQYQYQCLKGRSVPYAEQVKTLLDSSGLNVPPVSLSNVPGISESNVPTVAETNVPPAGVNRCQLRLGRNFKSVALSLTVSIR